jgi:hypothetical protein
VAGSRSEAKPLGIWPWGSENSERLTAVAGLEVREAVRDQSELLGQYSREVDLRHPKDD